MENEKTETENLNDFQIVAPEAGALATYIKAEIDMQIATAKAYPRSLKAFLSKVESIATVTQGVAESCTYAVPRKQYNKAKNAYETVSIKGPSVRLAEIVATSYGNLRSGARVISNDGRMITAQGICHDLESNNLATVEVQRKITDKLGRTFSEDMQVVTGNAACAIAYRNAIFKVVPSALIQDAYERVQEVARGTAETLVNRRDKAMTYFRKLGVKDEQICDVLSIRAIEDIDLDSLVILTGMKAAIVNKESTIEELFPAPDTNKAKADKANKDTEKGMKDVLNTKPK